MTGIVARTPAGESTHDNALHTRRVLSGMSQRGIDGAETWTDPAIAIGATWHSWQAEPGALARRGHCAIVVDATLYYRDDLADAVERAGVAPGGDSPAALILAAYEAFGDECTARLEGDFAFVLWDGARRRLLAGRDFGGKRPLFYFSNGDAFTIGSTIGGVLSDPRVPQGLNMGDVGAAAAGLWRHGPETCRASVFELGAGHVLIKEAGKAVASRQFWWPPEAIVSEPDSAEAAAHVLKLLTRATQERLAPSGATAISLSGGWDSTAVFGAGQRALTARPSLRSLLPASLSFPTGDPGDEDDFIRETTSFWNTTPEWIRVDDVAFGDVRAAARERDEPFAHPFEGTNRALARVARRMGARVILDGSGGDQLFAVSDVYLADLFRSGRLVELVRQWRTRGDRSARALFQNAVRPCLSDGTLAFLARMRGMGPPRHYLDRTVPVWMRHAFLKQHGVFEREMTGRPKLPRSSAVLAEVHAYLLYAYAARVASHVRQYVESEGVEDRSPLLDARLVAFAGARPWYDKVDGRETKILLRRAVRGLAPDRVLAPRAHRTGITTGYFARSMQRAAGQFLPLLDDSRLADLGAVNPDTLRRAWEYFVHSADSVIGVHIYFTLQAELWLREHESGGAAPHPESPRVSIGAT